MYVNVFCNAVWYYAVRSMEFPSFEIKTEADSNDICECSHDDKPTGMLGLFRHLCSVIKLTCCSVPGTHDHRPCIVNLSNFSKYSIQLP